MNTPSPGMPSLLGCGISTVGGCNYWIATYGYEPEFGSQTVSSPRPAKTTEVGEQNMDADTHGPGDKGGPADSPLPPKPDKEEGGAIDRFCRSLPALPSGMSYSQGRMLGLSLLLSEPNIGVRAFYFRKLVQNRAPLDIKQKEGSFAGAGNVLYGVTGTAAGLAPLLHAGSLYAHGRDQARANPFGWNNIVNEVGDQWDVTRGIIASVVCW